MYVAVFFLFLAQTFHAISHTIILFRWRLLPRKDVLGIRYYFLFDAVTIAAAAFFVLHKYWIIAAVHSAFYLYIYLMWDTNNYTKRVLSWISLNWTESKLQWDLLIGAMMDIAIHCAFSYTLATELGMKDIVMGLVMTHSAVMAVMYNSRLAWASPSSIPPWIKKRVDQQQATANRQKVE